MGQVRSGPDRFRVWTIRSGQPAPFNNSTYYAYTRHSKGENKNKGRFQFLRGTREALVHCGIKVVSQVELMQPTDRLTQSQSVRC